MIAVTLAPGFRVNLNLLETFLLVADLKSFTGAAARSGRSNSAVSSQVKQLEDQLEVALFDRTTRTVHLTEQGRILAEAARKGMAELRSGLLQLHDERSFAAKRITIACSSSLAWQALPPIIEAYRTRARNIQVNVIEIPSSQMADQLLAGEVAFGLGALDGRNDTLVYETLIVDPIVALIPNAMPQSRLTSITLRELAALWMILPGQTSLTRRVLEAGFERAGVSPRVKHEGIRFHTLLAMVEAGHGVAAFSELSSRQHRGRGFSRVPISDPGLSIPLGIIRAKDRSLTKAQERLIDLIRRESQNWQSSSMGALSFSG
jgi:DNA-binding transcriptional LysR family regulator